MGTRYRDARLGGDPSDWLWQLGDSYDVGLFDDETAAGVEPATGADRLNESTPTGIHEIKKHRRRVSRVDGKILHEATTAGPSRAQADPSATPASGIRKHRRSPADKPPAGLVASRSGQSPDETGFVRPAAAGERSGNEIADEPTVDAGTAAVVADPTPAETTAAADAGTGPQGDDSGLSGHDDDLKLDLPERPVMAGDAVAAQLAAPSGTDRSSRHRRQRRSRHDSNRTSRTGAIFAVGLLVVAGAGLTGALSRQRRGGASFQANVVTGIPPTTSVPTSSNDPTGPQPTDTPTPTTAATPAATGIQAAQAASPPIALPPSRQRRAVTAAPQPVSPAPPGPPVQVFAASPTYSVPPATGTYTPFTGVVTPPTNPPPPPPPPTTTTTRPPVTTTTAPPPVTTTTSPPTQTTTTLPPP